MLMKLACNIVLCHENDSAAFLAQRRFFRGGLLTLLCLGLLLFLGLL